ncbi:MAG TPA: GxxExxY protein [Verrucomicrobiae bacterium]|nr:GxxExxY protein [Verrucomicrobiae bacterium]
MHENEISEQIIGAAIEVHRYHGPGLVEQIYEESLCHELHLRSLCDLNGRSLCRSATKQCNLAFRFGWT